MVCGAFVQGTLIHIGWTHVLIQWTHRCGNVVWPGGGDWIEAAESTPDRSWPQIIRMHSISGREFEPMIIDVEFDRDAHLPEIIDASHHSRLLLGTGQPWQ